MPSEAIRRKGRVCDPGPWEVTSREVVDIPLDLRKGERARGRLVEEDGQDFDWAIVDGPGSVLAIRGQEYDYYDGGESVNADWVDFKQGVGGQLYLVLEVPRRVNKRSISVELSRV